VEQICEAGAELRLQGSIHAVLWNKYPIMDRF
jgi:hypothetical protein